MLNEAFYHLFYVIYLFKPIKIQLIATFYSISIYLEIQCWYSIATKIHVHRACDHQTIRIEENSQIWSDLEWSTIQIGFANLNHLDIL